jgi:dolichol-phosphate mannosyltransferase
MHKKYKQFKEKFRLLFPKIYRPVIRNKLYVKFFITGAVCSVLDISLVYILTDVIGVWYLFSVIFVYIFSFFTSFYLQKYWTFKDGRKRILYEQLFIYFSVGLINLAINTFGVYVLVEKFGFYYLFAQVVMMAVLSIESFLVYRFVIFKKKRKLKKITKLLLDEDASKNNIE